MGRHGRRAEPAPASGLARWLPIAFGAVLVIGLVLVGLWWWNDRPPPDPIDADPIATTATVVTSTPCSSGDVTTVVVDIDGQQPTVQLAGCGFNPRQTVPVEYLRGSPQQARLAGTAAQPRSVMRTTIIPLSMLVLGAAGVAIAVWWLLRTGGERRRTEGALSVADLQRRLAEGSSSTESSWPQGYDDSAGRSVSGEYADRAAPAGPAQQDLAEWDDDESPSAADTGWAQVPGTDLWRPDDAEWARIIDPGEPVIDPEQDWPTPGSGSPR